MLLAGVLAGLISAPTTILDAKWWAAHFTPTPPSDERQRIINAYGDILRLTLITTPFAVTEGSLRLFLRALDPQACDCGRASFESIYTCLLSKLGLNHWREFLRFWRLARNTCHNRGVHLPPSGRDETAELDGMRYLFRVGKPVRGMGWSTAVRLPELAVQMLSEIVRSPQTAAADSIYDVTAATYAAGMRSAIDT